MSFKALKLLPTDINKKVMKGTVVVPYPKGEQSIYFVAQLPADCLQASSAEEIGEIGAPN